MENKSLPLCTTCAHAWLARQGYVRGCAYNLDESSIEMYKRCVNAAIDGTCSEYEPRQNKSRP